MACKVINTENDHSLAKMLTAMEPGCIERQEAAGQGQLVASELLPAQCSYEDRAILEAAGVKFGEPVPGDRLFVNVELPAGWMKRRTDHSMWSELVDDTGKVRASIFYKAAFYDRDAFMRATKEANPDLGEPSA